MTGRTEEAEQYRNKCGKSCGDCDVAVCVDEECGAVMPCMELLPGFAEFKARPDDAGKPSDWVTKTVDKNELGAVFVKDGKPSNKSGCPHYAGYWFSGGIGSVQCSACAVLLPGLQWDIRCGKDFEECVFYKHKGVEPV